MDPAQYLGVVSHLRHPPWRDKRGRLDRAQAADSYANQHADIATSGTNPLVHYLNHGWFEGRNPGPLFDNDWYLRQYRDVPGISPLSHYLCYGIAEGRAATDGTRAHAGRSCGARFPAEGYGRGRRRLVVFSNRQYGRARNWPAFFCLFSPPVLAA